jgi:hypothetical protein
VPSGESRNQFVEWNVALIGPLLELNRAEDPVYTDTTRRIDAVAQVFCLSYLISLEIATGNGCPT